MTKAEKLFGKSYKDLNGEEKKEYNREVRRESRKSESQMEKEREYDRTTARRAMREKRATIQALKVVCDSKTQDLSKVLPHLSDEGKVSESAEDGEVLESADEDEVECSRPPKRKWRDIEYEEDEQQSMPTTPSRRSNTTNAIAPLRSY